MNIWQSNPIAVDGISLQVHASTEGVDIGKVADTVYSSDLLLTPEQAMELADALTEGAAKCLAERSAP
jgi:hypothetical protein